MAVILQRFSREISSSGLGRRPLTAETRVRVPVSLPAKPSPNHARGLHLSTEISSSGLGRRPLTAETRVRVPVSLPSKAFSIRAGGFLVCCDKASARFPMPGPPCPVPRARFPVPQLSCGLVSHPRSPCGPSVTLSCRCKPPAARRPSWSRRCTTRPRPAAAGVAAVAGLSSGSCGWRHWRG